MYYSSSPLILCNAKANGFITLSKYPIEYLESLFVLNNFDATVLLTLTCVL